MKHVWKGILVCFMLVGLCGCGGGTVENNAPIIKLEGEEIKVGETRVVDVTLDTTLEMDTLVLGDVESHSWLDTKIYSNDDWIASFVLANTSNDDVSQYDCIIEEISIYCASRESMKNYTFEYNGVNLIGANEEAVSSILKDFEREEDGDKVEYYLYEDSYSFDIKLENGVVEEIQLRHDFDKSYKEK